MQPHSSPCEWSTLFRPAASFVLETNSNCLFIFDTCCTISLVGEPFILSFFRRTISIDSLSGTLAASYASLSKIQDFTITYTKISGTLPTVFPGLRIFTVSSSLISGSLPDMTFWRNVTVLSFANNKLSGSFVAAQLPPNSVYFNASWNRLSENTLQLNALPATITLMDLSFNLYQGLLLKSSDLTVQMSQSTSLVVNLKGNHIFCPLPGNSELPSNMDLLADPCEIDYSSLIPYGTALVCALVTALTVFLLGKCRFKRIYTRVLTWMLLPRFLFAKYCAMYFVSVFSLVNLALNFNSMISALAVDSPDSCSLVNLKQLWINEIPAGFINPDGTDFPSPDIYSNFSQYASLLLSSFAGQVYPELVQENIAFFRRCAWTLIQMSALIRITATSAIVPWISLKMIGTPSPSICGPLQLWL